MIHNDKNIEDDLIIDPCLSPFYGRDSTSTGRDE